MASHTGLLAGVILAALVVLCALAAPIIATTDPTAIDPLARLQDPSAAHWFGTDAIGRDLFSRVIYGSRASLAIGVGASLAALAAGIVVGVLSGFFPAVDLVAMRCMDGLMAIPPILLAIALMTVMGGGVLTVIIAIAIAEVPRASRLVRAVTLVTKEEAYVQASITSGARPWNNIVRNIFPALLAPLVIHGTYVCSSAMLTESVLSFIGAGIPPTIPTWGNIMADGRALWQIKPGMVLLPAAALTIAVLAINMIGDAVRDVMDPRYSP
jgi:peptide/nickel transport system permease protein